MIKQFAQHMPSNCKEDTSEYLHPTHYDFKGSIDSEIDLLKDMYEYIEVKHEDIVVIREESNNSKNFGDCIEEILYKELNSYEGMEDAHKLTEERIFEMIHGTDEEDVLKVKRKRIFETLFDSTDKTLYYFLK